MLILGQSIKYYCHVFFFISLEMSIDKGIKVDGLNCLFKAMENQIFQTITGLCLNGIFFYYYYYYTNDNLGNNLGYEGTKLLTSYKTKKILEQLTYLNISGTFIRYQ